MNPEEKDAILYAKTGKLEKLIKCLDAGVSSNTADDGRASLMMHAAYRGHVPVVEELLKRGADADYVGYEDSTALFQAQQAGQTKIVELLQKYTSNQPRYDVEGPLQCPNPWQGYCALHDAIWRDFKRGGRELNEHENCFQALHPFLTGAVGHGFENMLRNRGYWCVPAGIRLFEYLGEPRYAAILRRVEVVIQRHATSISYDFEHDKPEDWRWDKSVSDALDEIEEEAQLWTISQEECDRLTRKSLEYVREHRQYFTGTA